MLLPQIGTDDVVSVKELHLYTCYVCVITIVSSDLPKYLRKIIVKTHPNKLQERHENGVRI